VQAAVALGDLSPERLARWRKLRREEAHNTASIAEQRHRSKALGRMYRSVQSEARERKGG
jgi:ribosome biogenesis GTPase